MHFLNFLSADLGARHILTTLGKSQDRVFFFFFLPMMKVRVVGAPICSFSTHSMAWWGTHRVQRAPTLVTHFCRFKFHFFLRRSKKSGGQWCQLRPEMGQQDGGLWEPQLNPAPGPGISFNFPKKKKNQNPGMRPGTWAFCALCITQRSIAGASAEFCFGGMNRASEEVSEAGRSGAEAHSTGRTILLCSENRARRPAGRALVSPRPRQASGSGSGSRCRTSRSLLARLLSDGPKPEQTGAS